MKLYTVMNDEGRDETLEVAAETDLGYHVKILVAQGTTAREYRDFIARNLFETLLKDGTLELLGSEVRAG